MMSNPTESSSRASQPRRCIVVERWLRSLGLVTTICVYSAGCSDEDSNTPTNSSNGCEGTETGGSTSNSVADAPLGPPVDIQVTGHIYKPDPLPPPDLSAITVPSGFTITRAAEALGNARIIAIGSDGTIYITRRNQGDVLMLKDAGNGELAPPVRAASRPGVHGLALYQGNAYLATANEVFRAPIQEDGTFGTLEMIIHDLPDAGQHNTRMVQIGPDAMMYISIASTCNACNESNPENATIVRASLDGKQRAIWASGLRDTIGWGWHPQTGELWGLDHGIDWLGDDLPPEELNKIERGRNYGWPYFWGNNQVNPQDDPPPPSSRVEQQSSSVPMVLGYTAHASPMQMSFYDGSQFPAEYRGDAFVSMRGSWNRKPPSGYEVVRIRFQQGQAQSIEPFVTGFIGSDGERGRLCGNAIAADGSLLFTDDRNGVLYRVTYTGTPNGLGPSTIPATVMLEQAARGHGVPLAIQRSETTPSSSEVITVSSPAFPSNGAIPAIYSEYVQGVSFPLDWTEGPHGTQSYMIIMEDPDATMPQPFVHWVVWNVPVGVTDLREGLQEKEILFDPPYLRQGVTSRGNVGYLGPRPPEGDPAHEYHVQVFALDAVLDVPISGANRDDILAAASGHVLARGELIGNFARPESQVPRP